MCGTWNHRHTFGHRQPAAKVSYDAVPLKLLHVGVLLSVLKGYATATVTEGTMHVVATTFPESTLNGTPTAVPSLVQYYETYIAVEESGWEEEVPL